MTAYYCNSNSLTVCNDFARTENALQSRAWAKDPASETWYGFIRVPTDFIRSLKGALNECSYDYRFKLFSDNKAVLTSAAGMKWELHFRDAEELKRWKNAHFRAELTLRFS